MAREDEEIEKVVIRLLNSGRARCPQRAAALIGAFFVLAFAAFAADLSISVSAKQRYPWNGLVDLQFTITGTSGTKYDTSFTAKDMVGCTNITMNTLCKNGET